MNTLQITVTGADAKVTGTPLLTGGMVGLPVSFAFSEEWKDLLKTAVFRAGGKTVSCPEVQEETVVPWEIMAKTGCSLQIGVYGMNHEATLVIPTVWVTVGTITPGADPEGDPAMAPQLPVWKQTQDLAQQAMEVARQVRQDADAGMFRGDKGETGPKGDAPVRGVDYWTQEDKQTIKSYVEETILGGVW